MFEGKKAYSIGAASIVGGVLMLSGIQFPGLEGADPTELVMGGIQMILGGGGIMALRRGMKTGA